MKHKLVFLAILLQLNIMGQQHIKQSIGDLIEWQPTEQGLILKSETAVAELFVYRDNMVRVQVKKHNSRDYHSFAVFRQPQQPAFDIIEADSLIIIKTNQLELRIKKKPVRFALYNISGQLLSRDEPLNGLILKNDTWVYHKELQKQERIIGLGEKTGPLDKRGFAYTHWNTDNPDYGPESDPLYVSIPFFIGKTQNGFYGMFIDNPSRTRFDLGKELEEVCRIELPEGNFDAFYMTGNSPMDIIQAYTWLTGHMELPPKWALGFQQCKWSYMTDEEVLQVANTFRQKQIPADVIYLDIDYMDTYKVFTWNPESFAQPQKLIDSLKSLGFKTTIIIDPGIKIEKGYTFYESGLTNNYFLKTPDGENFSAEVWPGLCHFPDFSSRQVRDWWGDAFIPLVKMGVSGFWNDMNEIAAWGKEIPGDLQMDWNGQPVGYAYGKNSYGLLMSKATHEGVQKFEDIERKLFLTRAAYAGIQRYAALWTGDNQSTAEHMLLGVRLLNNIGLAGVPFCGVDIGGFGGDATPELYSRWIALGAFSPFFRAHAAKHTHPNEPWQFGKQTEDEARHYIRFRYSLMPYLYSAFYEAARQSVPVQRSLFLNYSDEEEVYQEAFQNQYLFGPDLMVAAVSPGQSIKDVYLPGERAWYCLYTDDLYLPGSVVQANASQNRLPLFVRAGGILVMQQPVMHTGQKPDETLEIHLYHGNETHQAVYYEDDGISNLYTSGYYHKRELVFEPQNNRFTISKAEGIYPSHFQKLRLVLHGFNISLKPYFESYYLEEFVDGPQKIHIITTDWNNFEKIIEWK